MSRETRRLRKSAHSRVNAVKRRAQREIRVRQRDLDERMIEHAEAGTRTISPDPVDPLTSPLD